jgi:hypothetical protein
MNKSGSLLRHRGRHLLRHRHGLGRAATGPAAGRRNDCHLRLGPGGPPTAHGGDERIGAAEKRPAALQRAQDARKHCSASRHPDAPALLIEVCGGRDAGRRARILSPRGARLDGIDRQLVRHRTMRWGSTRRRREQHPLRETWRSTVGKFRGGGQHGVARFALGCVPTPMARLCCHPIVRPSQSTAFRHRTLGQHCSATRHPGARPSGPEERG